MTRPDTREDILSLAACPFCGGIDLHEWSPDDIDHAAIRCNDCYAAGPIKDQVGDWRRPHHAWNRRAAPTPPAAERFAPTDEATRDQIAAVMLLHGTEAQQREAAEYATPTPPAAEAPGQEPAAVKPLEWWTRGGEWCADSAVGRYEVGEVGSGFIAIRRSVVDGDLDDDVFARDLSLDDAKAAAQADYEDLAASMHAPPTYADAEAKGFGWLQGVLKPFADVAEEYDEREADDFLVWKDAGFSPAITASFKLGNYRRALAAIRSLASPAKEPGQ